MATREREKEKMVFIEEWNEILDYKINEQNLRNPDFQFLYSALCSLLRSLNYDIESIKTTQTDDKDADISFKIRFCAGVNKLYQLSNERPFSYLDLVSPTPKKTWHVLKMLFNYYKYYDMVKNRVCERANAELEKYQDALNENNRLLMENEQRKKQAENVEHQLKEYKEKLPVLKVSINQLLIKEKDLQQMLEKKSDEIKGFEAELIKLDIKDADLNDKLVDEDDFTKNLHTIESLKVEFADLKDVAEHTRSSNVQATAKINDLTARLALINKLLDSHLITHYEDLVIAEQKLKLINDEIEAVEKDINQTKSNDAQKSDELNKILKDIVKTESELKALQIEADDEMKKLNIENSIVQKERNDLETELAELRNHLVELTEQKEAIIQALGEILRRIQQPMGVKNRRMA